MDEARKQQHSNNSGPKGTRTRNVLPIVPPIEVFLPVRYDSSFSTASRHHHCLRKCRLQQVWSTRGGVVLGEALD